MMADNDYSDASAEFKEYWEQHYIDPEIGARVDALRAEGRLDELRQVIQDYIVSREDWVKEIRETWEAAKRGEFDSMFKTPPHDPRE